jgi:branched-chain amino acid transport system ATP-binding protein
MPPESSSPSLEARSLTIRFGGHVAVDNVSCGFTAGTLTAIVGPNGAGKTTFFNLLSGQLRPSAGNVFLMGRDVTAMDAPRRTRAGVGRAFQLTNLFPTLTVQENVRLVLQRRARIGLNLWTIWSRHRSLLEQAREILGTVGLAGKAHVIAAGLSHGDQRKLEVAMLVALDPEVYMFDEPTAGMHVSEVPFILDLIRSLKARRDKTLLLVEHKMDVIRELADRIVVMHNGALVADGEPAEVIASPVVQQAYLGAVNRSPGEATQ